MSNKNQSLSTPVDILKVALEKERKAYHFYNELLKDTKVVMIQDILTKLRDEEYKHIQMIERELTRTTRG